MCETSGSMPYLKLGGVVDSSVLCAASVIITSFSEGESLLSGVNLFLENDEVHIFSPSSSDSFV